MKKAATILLVFCVLTVQSQEFSRKDSLRGNLTPLRTCYDVTFYDLFVMIDEQELSIERSYNIIHFTATIDFEPEQTHDVKFRASIIEQHKEVESDQLFAKFSA